MRNTLWNGHRVQGSVLCQNYIIPPMVLVSHHPSFEAVSCFICGRRRLGSTQQRVICLVLYDIDLLPLYSGWRQKGILDRPYRRSGTGGVDVITVVPPETLLHQVGRQSAQQLPKGGLRRTGQGNWLSVRGLDVCYKATLYLWNGVRQFIA